jgi:uncharacterized repeat protein (TIGR03803 family)
LRTDGSVFQILHRFDPGRPFAGANPQGALIFGRDGLLYGTTAGGSGEPGLGVPEDMQQWAIAYRLRTDGRRFEVLHAFHLDDREGVPTDGLTQASDGRLYGTCGISTGDVLETIFRMNANGSDFKILHVFRGSSPFYQSPGVIEGVPGKLFGVTLRGEDSHGTIFSLALDGSGFEVLHRFHGDDGAAPLARLTLERDDLANRTKRVLLGTTSAGGKFGEGEVFALRANGSHFTVLHDFAGYPRDGQRPLAPLTLGDDGNFYGTTQQGGWNACAPFEGCGTVFNLRDEDVTL